MTDHLDDAFEPLSVEQTAPLDDETNEDAKSRRQVRRERAKQLWLEATPVEHTLAERYLADHRGLVGPYPSSLRYHPNFSSEPGQRTRPALLASATDEHGQVTGLQATQLDPVNALKLVGKWAKLSVGTVGRGSGVRLGDSASETLCIGEGVETCLSRLVAGPADVRACLMQVRMIQPSPHHRRIEILVERGAEENARSLAEIYADRGLRAYLIELPQDFEGERADLNDLLRHEGVEAVRAAVAMAVRVVGSSEHREYLPEIHLGGGKLPANVESAVQALEALSVRNRRDGVYQRGGQLVYLQRTTEGPGGSREDNRLVINGANLAYLRVRMTVAACWWRTNKHGVLYETNADIEVVQGLINQPNEWASIPVLRGIAVAPTLRRDGSVLNHSGYDQATGLYADFDDAQFPGVPERPTREEALAALERVSKFYGGFPFDSEADKTVLLSALLTALVRHQLRAAPLFAFTAPKMASGKTLLATTVSYVALGRPPAMLSQAKDPESEKKCLFSLLLEGAQIVVIDNIEKPLQSDTMCSILTEPVLQDRVLGVSQTAAVPTTTTFMATGNNLVIAGDLTTRCLVCRLDPRCERPEEREFEVDLHEVILQQRGAIVTDLLTIIRAYIVAGRPELGLTRFGRFEQWSKLCRDPLVWLGMADPCTTRRRLEDADPVRDQLHTLMWTWSELIGVGTKIAARGVLERVDMDFGDTAKSLREVLMEVASDQNRLNARLLGQFLGRHAGRIEGGMYFEVAGSGSGGTKYWRLVKVD